MIKRTLLFIFGVLAAAFGCLVIYAWQVLRKGVVIYERR